MKIISLCNFLYKNLRIIKHEIITLNNVNLILICYKMLLLIETNKVKWKYKFKCRLISSNLILKTEKRLKKG